MEAIDAGIPVLVGWLHHNMLRGEPPMFHFDVWPPVDPDGTGRYSSPELAYDGPSWAARHRARRAQSCAIWISRQRAALHFINVGKIAAPKRLGDFC